MKRSIYIILSGIITSAAVLGWIGDKRTETPVVAEVVAQAEAPKAPKTLNLQFTEDDLKHYQEAISASFDADDLLWKSEMYDWLNDSVRELLQKVQPEMAAEDKASILAQLHGVNAFNRVKQIAVVDLKNSQVLVGDEGFLAAGVSSSGMTASDLGMVHPIDAEGVHRLSWFCVDESYEKCLATQQIVNVTLAIEHDKMCAEAGYSRMHCGGNMENSVNIASFLGLSDCSPVNIDNAVWDGVKASDVPYEAEGLRWHKVAGNVGGECSILSVIPEVMAVAAVPVENLPTVQEDQGGSVLDAYTIPGIIVSVGAGLIMILLGFVCTYSENRLKLASDKVREAQSKLDTVKNEMGRVKKEMNETSREKDKLSHRVETLEGEVAASKRQYQEVCQEAESLKQEVKKSQLVNVSLEEEKSRLEDALAAAAGNQRTMVDSPAHIAEQANMLSRPGNRVSSGKDRETEKSGMDHNRITAQANGSDLEDLASQEKSSSFFESFSDDSWDEIADSFDSIFATKSSKDAEASSSSLLDNGEPSLGMTNFLNEVRQENDLVNKRQDKRTLAFSDWKPSSTETGLAPVSDGLRSNRNGSSGFGLHGQTVSGLAAHRSADSISPISPDLKRVTPEDDPQSFKPAPSWTGKGIPKESGMDENSLYNALKRRAKDVSQMDMPAASRVKPGASGVFDYNRGLSKSGVFSVTGSRVDIDPASDTEYFKSLYEKFVSIQRECGESADKYTLEQFVTRLAREKERLMQMYHCRNIRFTVYAKDGKASLKATPQK